MSLATTKRCPRCTKNKDRSEFGLHRARPDGLRTYCRGCERDRGREKYHADPAAHLERSRRSRERNPRRIRDRNLRHAFGITLEQYEAMEAAQGGVCAICGEPESHRIRGKVIALAVDHDHDTGAVRQLLCVGCNTGLGKFTHDPATLRAAAAYLERHT